MNDQWTKLPHYSNTFSNLNIPSGNCSSICLAVSDKGKRCLRIILQLPHKERCHISIGHVEYLISLLPHLR